MSALETASELELALRLRRLLNGPMYEAHSDWCDYRQRNPAVPEDCDCSAYRTNVDDTIDTAELLAEKVIANHG